MLYSSTPSLNCLEGETVTTTYLLRKVPPTLWRKAKHRAIEDNISLRELIFRAVFDYLKYETEETGENDYHWNE